MKPKTVIITGGGQGIGRVLTQDLLEAGLNVGVLEIDREAGIEVRKLAGRDRILVAKADVSDEAEVKDSINKIAGKFGTIDCLINNAAINVVKSMEQLSLGEWRKVIDINLTGAFLCAKYALPYLKISKGCIINLCSTRAFMSEPDTEAYSASKGGIYALTHAMAISHGPDIRVNAVSPGWIDVVPFRKNSARKDVRLSEKDHSQHPAGRVGTPQDISAIIQFLMKDENGFITGQNFIVDGGMTKKMIYI